MTKRRILIILMLGIAAIASILAYFSIQNRLQVADHLTLYGNVDIRDVRVAFSISERIRSVLVDEGHRVITGQLLSGIPNKILWHLCNNE